MKALGIVSILLASVISIPAHASMNMPVRSDSYTVYGNDSWSWDNGCVPEGCAGYFPWSLDLTFQAAETWQITTAQDLAQMPLEGEMQAGSDMLICPSTWFSDHDGFCNFHLPTSNFELPRMASFEKTSDLPSGMSVSPSVPEPATWAMLIAGFGAVGFAARRRRAVPALQS